jgi:Tfp pilus assembly protein PilO
MDKNWDLKRKHNQIKITMQLPKNYFKNLTATRYREYLKLLPETHKDNTKIFLTLVFTFSALSIFGIFAINPTLSTIVELKKQLFDSTFVQQQLKIKIDNLGALRTKYDLINADLPIIYDAIPETASIPILTGQIQALAEETGITITSFRVSEVQLATAKQLSHHIGFTFFMEGSGSYEDMLNFSSSLGNFNRIVTIESISMEKDKQSKELILSLRGKAYFSQ